MKKHIMMSLVLVLGVFMTTSSVKADDQEKQRIPVEVSSLPESVLETIQEDYEDYRITEAWIVMSIQPGTAGQAEQEGAEQAGMGPTVAEGAYYEVRLVKEEETKTIMLTADGEEIDNDKDKEKENIYVIENEER